VIAEGVESEDQNAELIRLGCRYGQGFLYAPAGEACAIDERLSALSL
jgi:EAL domain-containing protein (putative c-di-GMP-specific phosphodiesterase class I)